MRIQRYEKKHLKRVNKDQKAAVVWFKRDLRIHDHEPLANASKNGMPVIPLYIFEPDYWQQTFSSLRQWSFIFDSLVELREECRNLGQTLIVRRGAAASVFEELAHEFPIGAIHAHEETGNGWSRARDESVRDWCAYHSVDFSEYPSNGIIRGLANRDDWARLRGARMLMPTVPSPSNLIGLPDISPGDIPSKSAPISRGTAAALTQNGGRNSGQTALRMFLQTNAKKYLRHISEPNLSQKYCSRLSSHLTWGTMSVREVVKAIQSRSLALKNMGDNSWARNLRAFESRLAWRCHFIQKLEDQPEIEDRCMHSAFESLREPDSNEEHYDAWKRGMTGYPLVDACMRSLNHGGWITFRMRAMLVSFASYNLWIDWRRSGSHLAQVFTDYEPGIHYSQLQMQSGVTSINAIRIYNPLKQSFENDPAGDFIRRWIPELRGIPAPWVHNPWKMSRALQSRYGCQLAKDYPKPSVDHEVTARLAKKRIKSASLGDDFRAESIRVFDKLGSRRRAKIPKARHDKNQLTLSF